MLKKRGIDMLLQGKVALITGAASERGIGRATDVVLGF